MLDIRETLRRRLDECEISRYRLAKLSGITERAINGMLAAKHHGPSDTLSALLDAAGLEIVPTRDPRAIVPQKGRARLWRYVPPHERPPEQREKERINRARRRKS